MAAERLNDLSGGDVPDLYSAVRAGGGDEGAIGSEGNAVDFAVVAEDPGLDVAKTIEVVPLPVSQIGGAIAEQLQRAAEVVGGELAISHGNAVGIGGVL